MRFRLGTLVALVMAALFAPAAQAQEPLPQVLVSAKNGKVPQLSVPTKNYGEFVSVRCATVLDAQVLTDTLRRQGYTVQVNCRIPKPRPVSIGDGTVTAAVPQAPRQARPNPIEVQRELLRTYKSAIFAPTTSRLGRGIKVAVIDTGVSLPGVVHVWDVANDDPDCSDGDSHGTHVASTIRSLAPEATILSIKLFGDAYTGGTDAELARSIYLAIEAGADIINLSLGRAIRGYPAPIVEEAIGRAIQKGIAVVCAMGNDGAEYTNYIPVSYTGTIRVAAADYCRMRAFFSNYPQLADTSKVIAATGVNVYATLPNGGFEAYDGTSMATPTTCGALAAVISKYRLSSNDAYARLVQTADRCATFKNESIPFVNLGRALGQKVDKVVMGFVMNASAGTHGGISNGGMQDVRVTVRSGNRIVGTAVADWTGYFRILLHRSVRAGTNLRVDVAKAGFVSLPRTITYSDKVTALPGPLPMVPVRPDGDVTVVLVQDTMQAFSTNDRLRQPLGDIHFLGSVYGPGEMDWVVSAAPFFSWNSLIEFPFTAVARSPYMVFIGGDFKPITSIVCKAWAPLQTIEVYNGWYAEEWMGSSVLPQGGEEPSYYSQYGRSFADGSARVWIVRNGTIQEFRPPLDPANDVPEAKWVVGALDPSTGTFSPINTILPPPPPDNGGGEDPDGEDGGEGGEEPTPERYVKRLARRFGISRR